MLCRLYLQLECDWLVNEIHIARDRAAVVTDRTAFTQLGLGHTGTWTSRVLRNIVIIAVRPTIIFVTASWKQRTSYQEPSVRLWRCTHAERTVVCRRRPNLGWVLGGAPPENHLKFRVSEIQFPAFPQDIFNKLICRKNAERLFFSSTSVRAELWNNKTKEILRTYMDATLLHVTFFFFSKGLESRFRANNKHPLQVCNFSNYEMTR